MEKWTLRENIAHWIHQLAYLFAAPEEHILIVKDPGGEELFSVAFTGGFCAAHPPVDSGFKLYCEHDGKELEL